MASHKLILVAGDSHCVILGNNVLGRDPTKVSQLPGVEVAHLGPALAYTLPMRSSLDAGAKLLAYVQAQPDRYDAVMLSFGEIDARAHVVKQAAWRNLRLSQVVDELVDHYARYVTQLIEATGLPVFLWGPVGSMPDAIDFYNPEYPVVGRERERNQATRLISRGLTARVASIPGAHHIPICEQLIDEDLCTRSEYYEDGVHLNRKGMHLAFKQIRSSLLGWGFDELAARFPEQVHVQDELVLRDVGKEAFIIEASSLHDPQDRLPMGLSAADRAPFLFHTQVEDRPRVVVDLGCAQMVQGIDVYNRRDGFQDRARSLKVSASANRYRFEPLYNHAGRPPWGQDGAPLAIRLERAAQIRYIQLELQEPNALHLAEIKVWASSFLHPYP